MGSNPERDWGRPSWPTNGGGGGGGGGSVRDNGGQGSGCRKASIIVAVVFIALPLIALSAVGYLVS